MPAGHEDLEERFLHSSIQEGVREIKLMSNHLGISERDQTKVSTLKKWYNIRVLAKNWCFGSQLQKQMEEDFEFKKYCLAIYTSLVLMWSMWFVPDLLVYYDWPRFDMTQIELKLRVFLLLWYTISYTM